MKTKTSRDSLKYSVLSLLILGIFFILGTGSLSFFGLFDIDVEKRKNSDGTYTEKETHKASNQILVWEGPQDDGGRWNGWVTKKYYPRFAPDSLVYIERVYILHGKRQGLCTRTYRDGTVEEEHYLNGQKIEWKKASHPNPGAISAFDLVRDRYPWFLFAMEAFGFDNQYVENYLDTAEMLLASYSFDLAEFDDFYDQVKDSISQTPYDSIIQSNNSMSVSIGSQRMKDNQLRLAVIDRYRSEGSSTYSILESSYPNYIADMSDQGVSGTDLMQFCHEMDDSLDLRGSLDPEDPFFVDSVDSRFFYAATSFLNTEKKSAMDLGTLKKSKPAQLTIRELRHICRKALAARTPFRPAATRSEAASTPSEADSAPSNAASTPSEVAEVVVYAMFYTFIEGDFFREALYDVQRTDAGVPNIPVTATQYVAGPSATSVTLNGFVMEDGGAEVTSRGIAWATHYNPTMDDSKESAGSGLGQFQVTLEGLTEGETYHARAYATNSAGTAYGNDIVLVAESTVGTKVAEPGTTDLRVYPNPASSNIRIQFRTETDASFELVIFDAGGRTVHRNGLGDLTGGEHVIAVDVSGLPNGMYHCQLHENGFTVATRELIVAR